MRLAPGPSGFRVPAVLRLVPPVPAEAAAVSMPITVPAASTSGPPESPARPCERCFVICKGPAPAGFRLAAVPSECCLDESPLLLDAGLVRRQTA
jgi:hypothetical protein